MGIIKSRRNVRIRRKASSAMWQRPRTDLARDLKADVDPGTATANFALWTAL